MIEVDELAKTYGGGWALRGITFRVEEGDIFGYIGPNGAGKTTSIRILATLLDPTSGQARVAGKCVIAEAEAVRRLVGYMPDNFGVYERITVWEYLDFFAAAYGLPRRDRRTTLQGILELTDLTDLRDRLTKELSKGMRQRLCLAKTLVHDPKVLVLDEPANGLDPRARIEFRALLKVLRGMGKTIFISSHILAELSDVCTAVCILEKGKVVASGPVARIREALQPHLAFRLDVLGDPARAAAVLAETPLVADARAEGSSVAFQFRGPREQVPELVRSLVSKGVDLVGLQEQKTDLEDLFLRLTKGDVA
ncbi:MAG TPA: ABC transporter ATP-binding protein [Planctomycetota bacterium]|nr:ABC transporter ATP-binding protein [Planctomycetota bacterium]